MIRFAFMLAGGVALATSLSAAAAQEARQADVWVGFPDAGEGFLLDTQTGALWMAGSCLKALAPATQTAKGWVSENAELVSVGRASAMLAQTFRIEIDGAAARVSVENRSRGGVQVFPDATVIGCGDGACSAVAQGPAC